MPLVPGRPRQALRARSSSSSKRQATLADPEASREPCWDSGSHAGPGQAAAGATFSALGLEHGEVFACCILCCFPTPPRNRRVQQARDGGREVGHPESLPRWTVLVEVSPSEGADGRGLLQSCPGSRWSPDRKEGGRGGGGGREGRGQGRELQGGQTRGTIQRRAGGRPGGQGKARQGGGDGRTNPWEERFC